MKRINFLLIIVAVTLNVCVAQGKWTWPKRNILNEKQRDYYPYARADRDRDRDRDREPTTKRPLPGQPQNDDIDDYTDTNEEASKQNSPYLPNGVIGHPLIAGNQNGFGNYPQFTGNVPNGILVGPGGPTGIIGRPPGHFPAGIAPSSFPGVQGGYPGYQLGQQFPGAAVNNNPGFTNYNSPNNVVGPYPYANVNNPQQQFPAVQYPQTQFSGVQYPHQPQYTEGYGLANLNNGFNLNPHFNSNFNPNYGFGFDDYPEQVEAKSANVKSINKKVDDKVTKNLKNI